MKAACKGLKPDRVRPAVCAGCERRWDCLHQGLTQSREVVPLHDFLVFGGMGVRARRRLLADHGWDVDEALIAAWRAENPETPTVGS